MIIAHTSPWGGVFNVTEYLTAPWFAMILGISLQLAWGKSRESVGEFAIRNLIRGLWLIVIGIGLQALYPQIDVVLQTLGLLTIILAPFVGSLSRAWAAIAVALVGAVVSPLLMQFGRSWLAANPDAGLLGPVVAQFVAGDHYRVVTFVVFAAAGMVTLDVVQRGSFLRNHGLKVIAGLVFCAGTVYALGKSSPVGADAYSGTMPEIVGATLLSLAATWTCAWTVEILGAERSRSWLGAVIAAGRMPLTAYALQILTLALVMAFWLQGQRDDTHGSCWA